MTFSSSSSARLAGLSATHIENVFNQLFCVRSSTYFTQTRLSGGAEEPIYAPSESLSEIRYCQDHAASALHEAAHWCVAGKKRRRMEDYGYWYAPDGRNDKQQAEFERVEVKPQALEWIFSIASLRRFRVSADNLENIKTPSLCFKTAIFDQVCRYIDEGLPRRASMFAEALHSEANGATNPKTYLSGTSYVFENLH